MESASRPLRYAGFWRRLTAYGIDQTIVQVIAFVVIWLFGAVAHAQEAGDAIDTIARLGWVSPGVPDQQSLSNVLAASGVSGDGGPSFFDIFIGLMVSGFYNIWFTAGPWQATPGKHWCKMQVIMADGMPLSLAMSAARWFASGVSWLPLGFGYLMIGFTREKLSMHDAICGTRVVYRD